MWERDTRLRRHRRELERPHDAADLGGRLHVAPPQVQLLVLLGGQCDLQLGGQLAGCLVADDDWIVGSRDDAAEIAQIEVGELALCRLGTIEPFGHA